MAPVDSARPELLLAVLRLQLCAAAKTLTGEHLVALRRLVAEMSLTLDIEDPLALVVEGDRARG